MLIKLNLIRQGGSKIDIDGVVYHFAPNKDGHHVADVKNKDHIKRFMSIDGYEPYEHGAPEETKTPNPAATGAPAATGRSPDGKAPVTDAYDAMSKDELIAKVTERTGKAPHPNTGEKSLRAALRELDKAAA